MGWWTINSVKGGGIDWNREGTPELYNGDTVADIMGGALDRAEAMPEETAARTYLENVLFGKINAAYKEAWGRDADLRELRAVVNFVTCTSPRGAVALAHQILDRRGAPLE